LIVDVNRAWRSPPGVAGFGFRLDHEQLFPNQVRGSRHSSAKVRPATHDDQIDYQGTCTIALELGSWELQVQGIDLLETRVMQQQGRIVRGQPRPLTELPFRHSTGETHDPNTF
jgi:hypothetical protein